jgi:uncharacterized membrane protein
MIDAVSIASPGWIQLVGQLNPLKTIADFITGFRAENTKRMEMTERVRLEREKVCAKLATDVLRMMPVEHRWEGSQRLPEVVRTVIEPATATLMEVARDHRLRSAEIVRPGLTLPDDSSPSSRRMFKDE